MSACERCGCVRVVAPFRCALCGALVRLVANVALLGFFVKVTQR